MDKNRAVKFKTLISVVAIVTGLLWLGRIFVWNEIPSLFGPPVVTPKEEYRDGTGNFRFDHSLLDDLLHTHVDDNGWVDYKGLLKDPGRLDLYIASVAEAPSDRMDRDEKLALLINAYNAFTLRLILDYWRGGKLKSIKDIPDSKRWDDRRWNVGGYIWSLNQIEHEQIRPKFVEPRIHFALVCAAIGCPKLRNEAYEAGRIERQLEDQARYAHNHKRWFRFDALKNVVYLTPLYDWYGGDFEQAAGSVLSYAARYSPELRKALSAGRQPDIRWLDYDWRLNVRRNID